MFLQVVSCQKQVVQRIEFVKDGIPKDLVVHEMKTEGGYLQGDESFFLKGNKVI